MDSGRGVAPGDGDAEFPRAKGLLRTRDGPLGAGALMLLWQMRRVYWVVSMSRIMWRLRVGSRSMGGGLQTRKSGRRLQTMYNDAAMRRAARIESHVLW
jgi:hypothetical protein